MADIPLGTIARKVSIKTLFAPVDKPREGQKKVHQKTRGFEAFREDDQKMHWQITTLADPRAAALADRHYSRKTVGAAQFAPPGRCLVLLTPAADALWVSSWQRPEYAATGWNVWVCTLFRNESPLLSSALIVQAVAATCYRFGQPPDLGMITFVDRAKVASPNPGYCFKQAGFTRVRKTKNGLVVLQCLPQDMPTPAPAQGMTLTLFGYDGGAGP